MKNYTLIILSLFFALVASCAKEDSVDKPSFEGTSWKLQGFYDSETGKVEQAEPKYCAECYVIEFSKLNKGEWKGHSSTNELTGNYIIPDVSDSLKFTNIKGTEINELFDGPKYMAALGSINLYELVGEQLKLFYGNKGNYLIYNRIL